MTIDPEVAADTSVERGLRLPTFSWWQLSWSVVATIVFVPLAFRGVSAGELRHILQQADWRPIVLSALLYVITIAAKTARWRIFFQPKPAFSVHRNHLKFRSRLLGNHLPGDDIGMML